MKLLQIIIAIKNVKPLQYIYMFTMDMKILLCIGSYQLKYKYI